MTDALARWRALEGEKDWKLSVTYDSTGGVNVYDNLTGTRIGTFYTRLDARLAVEAVNNFRAALEALQQAPCWWPCECGDAECELVTFEDDRCGGDERCRRCAFLRGVEERSCFHQ